jgi:hypothetical protein
MSTIPALWKLRKEEIEFQDRLGHVVKPCLKVKQKEK